MNGGPDTDAFAAQAAALIGLDIPVPCRAGVAENVRILAGHAARVLDFDLPGSVESTAEFTP